MAKKEKKVDYTAGALLGTLAIVVISIAVIFLVNLLLPFRRETLDEELFFFFGNFFTLATFALSLYLIFVYLRDYMELKSRFTLGVLAVIVSLMLFALTSNPLLHTTLEVYRMPNVFPVIPYFFATISLAILAWISSS